MKMLLAIVLTLVSAVPLAAKPKTKTYTQSPKAVFAAALSVARTHHVVTYVNEKNMLFTFETGASATSYGFVCNASVVPDRKGANLVLNVQKKPGRWGVSFVWGAGGRLAKKFFKQVQERLAQHKQKPEKAISSGS